MQGCVRLKTEPRGAASTRHKYASQCIPLIFSAVLLIVFASFLASLEVDFVAGGPCSTTDARPPTVLQSSER
jgi:hypothetical protein